MRRNIVHEGAGNLRYEIREIVITARQIRSLGQRIVWENIGDPIEKGEVPPEWIRQTLHQLLEEPASYGYCDTAGVIATREFLAESVNRRKNGVQITPDDIIFFNGVGDAVEKVYGFLKREARVLGPSPAYSTHSSAEAAHSGYNHVTYDLDPYNGWLPDVDDIRNKVKYNDSIAGILILSPDNPTGVVWPREILDEIVKIAQEHDLFLIADEIYAHITFPGQPHLHMSQWAQDVPAIAMRGISKEYPWPGARCGWIEVLNRKRDQNFSDYVDSILAAKRLEVCSTTLPQMSIPKIFGDPRYKDHLHHRASIFEQRAEDAVKAFEGCDAVVVNKPGGAFYLTVMFKEGVLNSHQKLRIENPVIRERIEELVQNVPADKRFVYYLMGATGIVVVPLTGFHCRHDGFRVTLLESDDAKRRWIFQTLRKSIDEYVNS
ncbi:MAG TPA: pyridoxal phosphate-dependent aminotransferase [Candidatus Hydrogenedentes bacterium]|nr:pyridoxal phosphate-dependent aminotransferase [Candidatus Hydrogenedentota bacterium]